MVDRFLNGCINAQPLDVAPDECLHEHNAGVSFIEGLQESVVELGELAGIYHLVTTEETALVG